MKVLAFAASSSKSSINKKLVTYSANLLEDIDIEILDLNDYELPLFSEDKEKETGQPKFALEFLSKIEGSDAIIISFAEHNGSYSVSYKNIFDWCSRINPKVFQKKPMILLSTSPGGRGASTVLSQAVNSASHFDGEVISSYSVPSFYENFDIEKGCIINKVIQTQLALEINKLQLFLNNK